MQYVIVCKSYTLQENSPWSPNLKPLLPFLATDFILFISSCKKDSDIIANNNAPYYGEIPTILLENYVNRIYIDLIGREPLDNEMLSDVQFLRDADITLESRDSLLYKLQFDTTFVEGDFSLSIYNRHGQEIWISNNPGRG